LTSLVTSNGSYLFNYLNNATGIILDGCTSVTSANNAITYTDKTQMKFDKMPKL